MRRSNPQPDGARRRGLIRPKPPRVIVSGDDAEDPAEWDVVVVENDAIDNERAIEIARARHRALAGLPSLDEDDIAKALGIGAGGPAEGADDINEDAFALPGDTPVVRRAPEAPIHGITFDGVDEPGGEPTGQHKVVSRFPTETGHMMSVLHEPDPDPAPAAPEADGPTFAEPDEVLAADATPAVPAPDPVEPASPQAWASPAAAAASEVVDVATRFPVDNVDDGFYDIGDEVVDTPTADADQVAPDSDEGLQRDDGHALEDDPHHTFYAIDDTAPATSAVDPVPLPVDAEPPQEVRLWGSGRAAAADGNVYQPGEVPPDRVEPQLADPAYASFPIDPDEFLTEEGADVDVAQLDYASVFGPVDAPAVLAPVPVAAKSPELDPVEVASHAPITESPARRRRRKAAAAGAGAGAVGGVVARSRRATADEADQFQDLRGPDGNQTFDDLRGPIEADGDEWGWRDEFIDEPTGSQEPMGRDESGYAFTFDDDVPAGHDGPLLIDERPRHIRDDAPPRRGRRELVALGAAALIVLAVAASSKVFNSADRPEFAPSEAAPDTTGRATIPPSSTTSLTIEPVLVPPVPEVGEVTTTTQARRSTSTTVRKAPPTTTTTTTAAPTTTTTAAPTTTTTAPPPTTTTTPESPEL